MSERPCQDCPLTDDTGFICASGDWDRNGTIRLSTDDEGQLTILTSVSGIDFFSGNKFSWSQFGHLSYSDYPELLEELSDCEGPARSKEGLLGKVGLGHVICPALTSTVAKDIVESICPRPANNQNIFSQMVGNRQLGESNGQ